MIFSCRDSMESFWQALSYVRNTGSQARIGLPAARQESASLASFKWLYELKAHGQFVGSLSSVVSNGQLFIYTMSNRSICFKLRL